MIIQVIAAFAAIFTFAMALEIPKKYLINCGFIGAAGWFLRVTAQESLLAAQSGQDDLFHRYGELLVYLVVLQRFGMMTANLLGAAAITLLAPFFARIKKAPVTIFLIPGFLTLVPGAGLYRSVHYFFIGNRSMGAAYLVQTLQIAGVIALGIFMVDSLVEIIGKRKQKEEKNNQSQVKK